MKTATTKAPLHRVTAITTGGVRGKGRNREKQNERGKRVKDNPSNDSYAYTTKCGGNRTR